MPRPDALSVRVMNILIISAPKSQHVRITPSDDVDDSKVVEDVHISSKAASIIEKYQLVSTHRLLMKSTCLLIVPVMTWVR